MKVTRPTYMEINLNNFLYNMKEIKKYVPTDTKLMPVIKANAYGTYINTRMDILKEYDIVAVASVDEAVNLRKLGYKKEIFVLNQPYKTEIHKIIKYCITIGLCSYEFLKELSKHKKKVKVHLEVETGMGRTGIYPEKIKEFIKKIPSNVIVEGIYTHFSSADFDELYTKKQIDKFNEAVNITTSILGKLKYIHSSASNGIINYPNAHFNLVRPGIIMHGYKSANDTLDKISLKPVAQLKSTIIYLKEVEPGTSISYGQRYTTTKKSIIATIPIGYADGLKRELSNDWCVIIHGEKAKILGSICMDSFMADVTNIKDVKVGDEVYIWDNENITLEDIAEKCHTINYEIISTISDRVPRKFIK